MVWRICSRKLKLKFMPFGMIKHYQKLDYKIKSCEDEYELK